MQKKTYITVIILIGLMVAGLIIFFKQYSFNSALNTRPLPDFSLEDYEGNIVRSSDLVGTPLLVNAWATWCPFCQLELVDFAEVQNTYQDQLKIISIDRGESKEVARSYTDRLGVTDKLILLIDPDDSFYKEINGFSMPETVFVDTRGDIVYHRRGAISKEELIEKIEELFGLSSK